MLTNNQQDFAESCPEFSLTIPLDGEDVNQAAMMSELAALCQTEYSRIKDDNNSNDATSWYHITPVVNHDITRSNLKRHLIHIRLVRDGSYLRSLTKIASNTKKFQPAAKPIASSM